MIPTKHGDNTFQVLVKLWQEGLGPLFRSTSLIVVCRRQVSSLQIYGWLQNSATTTMLLESF